MSNNAKLKKPAKSVKHLKYYFNNSDPIDGLWSLTYDFPNLETLYVGDSANTTATPWITNIDAFQGSLKEIYVHNQYRATKQPNITSIRTSATKVEVFNLPELDWLAPFDVSTLEVTGCPKLEIDSRIIGEATNITINNVKSVKQINQNISSEIKIYNIADPEITLSNKDEHKPLIKFLSIGQPSTKPPIVITDDIYVDSFSGRNLDVQGELKVTKSFELGSGTYKKVTHEQSGGIPDNPMYRTGGEISSNASIEELNLNLDSEYYSPIFLKSSQGYNINIDNINLNFDWENLLPYRYHNSNRFITLFNALSVDSSSKINIKEVKFNIKKDHHISVNETNLERLVINFLSSSSDYSKISTSPTKPKTTIDFVSSIGKALSYEFDLYNLSINTPSDVIELNLNLSEDHFKDYFRSGINTLSLNTDLVSTDFKLKEVIFNNTSNSAISDEIDLQVGLGNSVTIKSNDIELYTTDETYYDRRGKRSINYGVNSITEESIIGLRTQGNMIYLDEVDSPHIQVEHDASNDSYIFGKINKYSTTTNSTTSSINSGTFFEDSYYFKKSDSTILKISNDYENYNGKQLPRNNTGEMTEEEFINYLEKYDESTLDYLIFYTGSFNPGRGYGSQFTLNPTIKIQQQPVEFNTGLPSEVVYGDTLDLQVDITNKLLFKEIKVYKDRELLSTLTKESNYNYRGSIIADNKFILGENELRFEFISDYSDTQEATRSFNLLPVTVNDVQYNFTIPREKEYDGVNYVQISMTVENFTPKLTDNFTFTYGEDNTAEINESSEVVINSDLIQMHGDNSQYYVLNKPPSTTHPITITPKSITASVQEVSKKYDGTNNIIINEFEVSGLLPIHNKEDVLEVKSATFDDSEVGENKTVTIEFTLKNNNYRLTQNPITTTGSITKADAVDNIGDIVYQKTITYGDNLTVKVKPEAKVSKTTPDKIELYNVNGDLLATSNLIDGKGYYVVEYNTNDRNLNIGENIITVKFLGNTNISAKETTITVNMNPKELYATYDLEYEYDGLTEKFAPLSLTGQIGFDNPTSDVNLTLDSSTINAGDNVTVNSKIPTISDEYYIIPENNISGTIIITADKLNLNTNTPINKKYDGTTKVPPINLSDIVIDNSSTITNLEDIIDLGTYEYDSPNVGSRVITISPTIKDSNPNYIFEQSSYNILGEITKSNTQQGIGDIQYSEELTFGDILTLKVKPLVETTTKSINLVTLSTEDGTHLATSTRKDGEYYVVEYDTSDRKVYIGDSRLKVEFLGDNNLNSSSTLIDFKLNPKEISADYNLTYEYDGLTTKQVNLNLKDVPRTPLPTVIADLTLNPDTINANDDVEVLNTEYSLNDVYLYLPEENITGSITITAWDANVHIPEGLKITQSIRNNVSETVSQTISSPLGKDTTFGGLISTNLEDQTVNNPEYMVSNNITESGNLSELLLTTQYQEVESDQEIEVGKYTYTVNTNNISNLKVVVTVISSNSVPYSVNIEDLSIKYGTEVTENILEYEVKDINQNTVSGVLELNSNTGLLDVGNYLVDYIFIPEDSTQYIPITGNFNVTVNKALAIQSIKPNINIPNKTLNKLSDFTFIDLGEYVGFDSSPISDYVLEWENDDLDVIINQSYNFTLIHKNYYYNGTIIPYPTYELPQYYPDSDTVVFPGGALVPNYPDADIDENGNVEFPTDTVIELPNGDRIEVNKPNVNYPDSDNKTNVTLPDGEIPTFDKDVNLILPPKTTYPEDNGTAELPNGGIVLPDGTIKPNLPTFVVTPDGDLIIEGEITVKPNPGYDKDKDGNIIITIKPPTTVTDKDENDKFPDGNGGEIILTPDGEITFKPTEPETEITTEQPTETTTVDNNSGNGAIIGEPTTEQPITKPTTKDLPFDDIEGGWYEDVIVDLNNKGIVNGYNRLYKPNNDITRADFAIMIYNLLENIYGITLPEPSSEFNYNDTSIDTYYYKYVNSLSSLNILEGYGNGTFKPTNNITREEASVVIDKLVDYLDLNIQSINRKLYQDEDEMSWWAKSYIDRTVSYGLMSGYEDNTFKPKKNITRAETAQILYNLIYTE